MSNMICGSWRGFGFLGRVSLLLLCAQLIAVPKTWAGNSEVPMSMQLLAEPGQNGVLRYVADRYDVRGASFRDPLSTPVTTGFELSFVGTIPSAGRVKVKLDLVLWLAEKHSRRHPGEVQELTVAAEFEVADGDSYVIPETVNGPEVVATPRIVLDDGGSPTAVLLKVDVPIGGRAVALPRQRLVKNISLIGTEGSVNSIHEAAGHSFVTGVTDGEAILTTLETGARLAARTATTTATDGGTSIRMMDFAVGCDLVDDNVATKRVRGKALSHKLHLPVARSVHVDTVASVRDGSTIVLAGIQAGEGDTEIHVFVTPRVVDAPAPQVQLEARILLIGGGGVDEVEGTPHRNRHLKTVSTQATEPRTGLLFQSAERSFVVGHRHGEDVTLSLESETALVFTPSTLPSGDHLIGVNLAWKDFEADAPRFSLGKGSKKKFVELPESRSLELVTNVAVRDGETVVLGGRVFEQNLPKSTHKLESLFFATANVLGDGAVRLEGRLVRVDEETTRESRHRASEVEQSLNEELFCAEIETTP